MRIWSLHPQYLDTKGLGALWRETLLAKHVLEGKTKGYKNHPQLERFKNHKNPLLAINFYLNEIYLEAKEREYNFDESKFKKLSKKELEGLEKIFVNDKQVEYEFSHLMNKLKVRDIKRLNEIIKEKQNKKYKINLHSIFKIKKGEIETWEKF
ncbi:MAG: hypothetical protein QG630_164 [Patescibacteria group bacterium]|nr:hypothetical protein [Patescibacteria group bacterium]